MPADHVYSCVCCSAAGLTARAEAYECPSCGQTFPVLDGVPLFIPGATIEPVEPPLTEAEARGVAEKITFEPTPENIAAVQRIFARRARHPDPIQDAENAYYLDRFTPAGTRGIVVGPADGGVCYEITAHYLPAVMPAGVALTGNVRVENRGPSVISSNGPLPVYLAYHWLRPDGSVLHYEGERTRLPIDLAPGRALTVPLLIRTPPAAQAAVLEVTMVHEGVAWVDRCARRIPVRISDSPPAGEWQSWPAVPVEKYDSVEDHILALNWLSERLKGLRPGGRILEVGGSVSPIVWHLPHHHHLYNVDVDFRGLRIGRLKRGGAASPVHFVCADAVRLPFPPGTIDAVAMFAALHHFPDPTALLVELRRVLKPGGLVAVLCEPVGHYFNGNYEEDFIDGLRNGLNEQMFSLAEYEGIFRKAGLRPDGVKIHGGSLKAFLRAA
jgi:SAM-dependent methyltransferase